MVDILNQKYLGKQVKVAFDDGQSVSIRIGIFRGIDGGLLILDTTDGVQSINRTRVIRIEEKGAV